jgi:DNA-binding NtrC family response regulator
MCKILVVDDDDAIRTTLQNFLLEYGYEASSASNGKEALKLIARDIPDLVIIDLIMPEKEGIETIFELQKKYKEIKIIAMSGGGMISADGYLEIVQKAGVKHTLAKPFETEKLLDIVQTVFDQ